MNTKENAIIRTVPAVGALNKVPGFDPLKHLQRATNEKGEKIYRLGLRYKRLWFRLAHPNGRLLLNPLRITDQMAIFEAQVFFQREDPTPASSFTSTKTARENRDYARAAQDEALSVALDNAGFGIQLCDMAQDDSDDSAPETMRAQSAAQPKVTPQQTNVAAEPAAAVPKEEPKAAAATASNLSMPQPAETAKPVEAAQSPTGAAVAVQEKAPVATTVTAEPQQEPQAAVEEPQPVPAVQNHVAEPSAPDSPVQKDQEQDAPAQAEQQPVETAAQNAAKVTVLDFPARQSTPEDTAPASMDEAEAATETPAPTYTEDMPVEDIAARMTMDEAKALIVDSGTCKGWTMAEVMEKRPSSLKFFISPFCQCGNILKAAATLLLQELGQQQKAG